MNLWDIENKCWHEELLSLAAGASDTEDLRVKLGSVPHDSGASIGTISPYFVRRYGFAPECEIAPSTGDNLSTILSLPLQASDAIVSLGTSTTFLMSTPEYRPHPSYHFMNHPTTPGLYMFMLCYKNGGLARENVRDALNAKHDAPSRSWDLFNETATLIPPLCTSDSGDPAQMGLYFPRHEIVPNLPPGTWRCTYDTTTKALRESDSGPPWKLPEDDARAIIESQMLSLRLRSSQLVSAQKDATGRHLPPQPRRIYLVGGGSVNPAIAKVCGDVLGGAEGVYRLDIGGNACALGAAYKAVWACERSEGETFEQLIGKRWNEEGFVKKIDDGYKAGIWEKYGEALGGFAEMEKRAVASLKKTSEA